jgi:hypothetical protein
MQTFDTPMDSTLVMSLFILFIYNVSVASTHSSWPAVVRLAVTLVSRLQSGKTASRQQDHDQHQPSAGS